MTSSEELIYTADAAQLLGVDIRTIQRMAADGRLEPAVEPRGVTSALVFRKADVEALRSQKAAS